MIFALLVSTVFAQELMVDDPTGCIDDTLVEGELEVVIGPAVRQLGVSVRVSGDDPRQVSVQAYRIGEDELALRRVLEIREVDCPLGGSVIARAVHRGLDALPGWSWGRAPERTWVIFGVGAGMGTGPALPALQLSTGASIGLPGRLRVPIRARGQATSFTTVGTGQAQVIEMTIGTGFEVEAARPWIWPHVLIEGGAGLVRGRNFQSNQQESVPRLALRSGVDLGFTEVAGLTLDLTIPMIRSELIESGTGVAVFEPSLRLDLGITLRWAPK